MNILITGASGLIGRATLDALLAAGHHVHAVCRQPPIDTRRNVIWHAADITSLQTEDWLALLDDVTLVINAVGIFREAGAQTFAALHTDAAITLFDACVLSGVDRLIQISALGAAAANTSYARSKGLADAALRTLPLDAIVIRPSLVYADQGRSSELFRQMAAWPVLVVPQDAGAVQAIHLDDLTAAIVRIVEHPKPASLPRILPAVGPTPLAWADYLQALRQGMGLPAAPVWKLGCAWLDAAAQIAEKLPNSLLSRDSLRMLRAGSCADASAIQALIDKPLRPPHQFAQAAHAAQAGWAICQPLLRLSLAFVWLWTAYVSLAYPAAGFALLHEMGLPATWHWSALALGSGLDALFGLLTLARPSRRLWLAQIALIGGYSLLITLFLPAWWLHPFGAVSKNLPMLAVLLALIILPRSSKN